MRPEMQLACQICQFCKLHYKKKIYLMKIVIPIRVGDRNGVNFVKYQYIYSNYREKHINFS